MIGLREFLKSCVGVFVVCFLVGVAFVSVVAGAVAITTPIAKQSCKNTAQIMNVEYIYDFWAGCMIKIGDNYIPLDKYIVPEVK